VEITYTTPNGRIQIRQEITKGKDAFEFVAKVQELFEEEACGCCHGKEIRCQVRKHDDYKFFEYVCMNPECGARLAFGQHKEGGTLFPKRWDAERQAAMPDNGWSIWKPDADKDESRPADKRYPERQPSGRPKESAANDVVPW
jgi:hypothetical protein